MNNTIVVAAGIIFRGGRILITQRPAGKHGALKWEFPGGKMEPDEDPRACLAREVHEELGVRITVGRILETVFHRYPERSVLLLFYRCDWESGDPVAVECAAFEWAAPSELLKFDFLEADLDFIRRLQQDLQA